MPVIEKVNNIENNFKDKKGKWFYFLFFKSYSKHWLSFVFVSDFSQKTNSKSAGNADLVQLHTCIKIYWVLHPCFPKFEV